MTSKSLVATAFIALLLPVGQPAAADRIGGALTCADLQWSDEVLAANPDVALACRGVFEKDGVLFAKATIEVVKVQGDTMKFRTVRTDGTKGATRSVELDSHWRVKLDGREYRARDLSSGQQLNIYLPQDRFALTVANSNSKGGDAKSIEQAESP
jgi:hypothetical protein